MKNNRLQGFVYIIDTGAVITTISPKMYKANEGVIRKTGAGYTFVNADGSANEAEEVFIDWIKIGGIKLQNARAVLKQKGDNLLGQNVLGKLKISIQKENNINIMTNLALKKSLDVVVSSRFKNQQILSLSRNRENLSRIGNNLIDLILDRKLTDPLSGCFLINKEKYMRLHHELFLSGFKILFDILSSKSGRLLKVDEVPIRFLKRHSGTSKLKKIINYWKICNIITP